MRRILLEYIKSILKKIFFTLSCFLLFIRNFLGRRKLVVNEALVFEKIVFEGNRINLFWNASGCHKIKVKNVGTFRGGSSGITFNFFEADKPIEICFYGVNEIIEKSIAVNGRRAEILNSFTFTSKLPSAIETSEFNKRLVNMFQDSLLKIDVRQPNLKTVFTDFYFEFDSFKNENHEA